MQTGSTFVCQCSVFGAHSVTAEANFIESELWETNFNNNKRAAPYLCMNSAVQLTCAYFV